MELRCKPSLPYLGAIIIAALQAGCSSYVPEKNDASSRDGIYVVAQVCLPLEKDIYKLANYRIGFEEAERYGPRGQYRSYGGSWQQYSWRSESGQFVFEKMLARKIDIIGLAVTYEKSAASFVPANPRVMGVPTSVQATYVLPDEIPKTGWTEWISPIAEQDNVQWKDGNTRPLRKLANGLPWYHNQDIDTHLAGDGAPKVRYRFIRVGDYEVPSLRRGQGQSEAIPSCPINSN